MEQQPPRPRARRRSTGDAAAGAPAATRAQSLARRRRLARVDPVRYPLELVVDGRQPVRETHAVLPLLRELQAGEVEVRATRRTRRRRAARASCRPAPRDGRGTTPIRSRRSPRPRAVARRSGSATARSSASPAAAPEERGVLDEEHGAAALQAAQHEHAAEGLGLERPHVEAQRRDLDATIPEIAPLARILDQRRAQARIEPRQVVGHEPFDQARLARGPRRRGPPATDRTTM